LNKFNEKLFLHKSIKTLLLIEDKAFNINFQMV